MELINGVDIIYLFRIKGEEGNAWKVAYQTEGGREESRSYETTETKDGGVKSAGAYEGSHSITALLSDEDEYIQKLEDLIREQSPKKLEVWRINRHDLDEDGEADTLPGEYSEDRMTSFSSSEPTDGAVEISLETEIEGKPVRGECNVTEELKDMLLQIRAAQIEFLQPTVEDGEDILPGIGG